MTEDALAHWVAQQMPAHKIQLSMLSGDAGSRRYFRLNASRPPLMAVYAPPSTENMPQYLAVSQLLANGGMRVPQIRAFNAAHGFMLIEDCGDQLLLSQLHADTVDVLYRQVLAELLKLQAIPAHTLPHYDATRLRDEMALCPHWFINELLGLSLDNAEHKMLNTLFNVLVDSAQEQAQVFVHRDFHSRNLMLLGEQAAVSEWVIIDFQDAVLGPVTYDLVSLLRDCYVRWSPDCARGWALDYRQQLLAAGGLAGADDGQFLRWFDLMGLQRHIKVLGIFARLYLRDGKAGYLNDLPLVLRYVLEVAAQHSECDDFSAWMQARVLPACKHQPWFVAWD